MAGLQVVGEDGDVVLCVRRCRSLAAGNTLRADKQGQTRHMSHVRGAREWLRRAGEGRRGGGRREGEGRREGGRREDCAFRASVAQ